MRSAMMVWVSLGGVGAVAQHAVLESQGGPQSPPVRETALDTLHDVAVAVYDPKGSIIYYNPDYLQRLGPQLSAFFMAHEYGHITLRHTRSHALAGTRKGLIRRATACQTWSGLHENDEVLASNFCAPLYEP